MTRASNRRAVFHRGQLHARIELVVSSALRLYLHLSIKIAAASNVGRYYPAACQLVSAHARSPGGPLGSVQRSNLAEICERFVSGQWRPRGSLVALRVK